MGIRKASAPTKPTRPAQPTSPAKGARVTKKQPSASAADSRRASPVTVVGIGASAGGLEALSEFFRHVPADTGLAYVVVQHLSPTHSSILAQLLTRHAVIPVHEAANGDLVEVNCAYVIAPDTKMTLTDGHLKLVPRDPGDRPPLPVDALFRSLADVQETRTIGVILSGTGSDGALGVRAIRGAGGITFAQDPTSAGSEGMPRAALATNCIDVVAAPAEIATQIAQIGRHPYLRSGPDLSGDAEANEGDGRRAIETRGDVDQRVQRNLVQPQIQANGHRDDATQPHDSLVNSAQESADGGDDADADVDAVAAICALLRQRFGVDFGLYKIGTVQRRIRRRMALRRADTIAAYAESLSNDSAELTTLYADMLIGVTRFFRDPEVFAVLSKTVFPELIRRRAANRANDAPLRLWVAGCATGEEAYSMAIAVLECVGDQALHTPVQIFATDLSESAIAVARAGRYPHGIEADVAPDRLRRFFTKADDGYRVGKAVRDCCVFAIQNITADPPFSQLDLVSCRNVLIYLQPSAHANVLSLFHYALKPQGVLVLGTSESCNTASRLFTAIDKKRRIYSRAAGAATPVYPSATPVSAARRLAIAMAARLHPSNQVVVTPESPIDESDRSPAVPEVQRAADHVLLGSYAPAGVVVDEQLHILQFRGQTGSYIEPAAGTASFHLLKMVKPDLSHELRVAIETAREEARPVRVERVSFRDGAHLSLVTLGVTPFRVTGSTAQFFIVSFEDITEPRHASNGAPTTVNGSPKVVRSVSKTSSSKLKADADAKEVGELRQELEAARRHLQTVSEDHSAVVEEFQAANEEVQSGNEELQSTNEEIETSKEELQSLNEELTTLNDELRVRNADADHVNDDLTNLLSAMHVPVIMVGTDLRIRRLTAGAERMMNVIPTDIGRPIGDIKSNIDVVDLEALISGVIDTLVMAEREVRDRNGCWYMMQIRPYRTSDRKIDGAVIVYHDIDARKRAAEELDSALRYAEAVVHTVREPLVVLNDKLSIISANRAFYEGFGTSPDDTTAHSLFDLGNGQWNAPRLHDLLERVRSTGEPFDDVEIEHDFPVVGHRVMLLNGRRLATGGAGTPLILLAMQDVTTRRIAESLLAMANAQLIVRADELEATTTELRGRTAEALASNLAKTEFLATMSHELRTPLNAIAGYAQLLDMGIRGPVNAAQRADLARITRSQEHLMGLISNILNFAKLSRGGVTIVSASVDVSDLLESVEAMIASQIEQKGLHYQASVAALQGGGQMSARGDAEMMRQILLNLLTNALKFTAPGGTIEVSCGADDALVSIRVRDTGMGIPGEKLNAIFDPFVQINPLFTRATEGIGLGLAISRDLARAMDGDVTVESELGVGSTFTVTLPRVNSARI